MPQRYGIPSIGERDFPDSMSQDEIKNVIDGMLKDKGKADARAQLESTLKGPYRPDPADTIIHGGISGEDSDKFKRAGTAEINTDKAASSNILQTLAGLVGGGLGGAATSGMAPGAAKGAITGLMGLAGDKAATAVTGQDPSLKLSDALSPLLGAAGGALAGSANRNSVARSQALVDALKGKEGTVAETVQDAKTPSSALDSLQNFFKDKVAKYLPQDKTPQLNKVADTVADAKVNKAKLAEDIFANKGDADIIDPLKAQNLGLNTQIAEQNSLKTLFNQQSKTTSWPKKIANIPNGPELAEKIANAPLTSEEFGKTLYEQGPRAAKVALAMVANHPDSATLTTQIRQGFTQKLLRETFNTNTNKFVGQQIKEKLIDNPETRATMAELYPGDKNLSQKLDDLAEICRAGSLENGLKQAFSATAKGLVTAGTMAYFGHGGPALAVAGTAAATSNLVPWGKAIDALMRNDALRKSALALAKSGNVEQAGAGAGMLFKNYLEANAEPMKKK